MTGPDHRRSPLHWVQTNRGPGLMPQRVGAHASAWCRGELARVVRRQSPFEQVIAEIDDPDFREQCRFGGFARGTLTVCVADARWVEPLRLRWQLEIRARCLARARGALVHRVEFTARQQDKQP
ncbi:MAG: hypothetical protein FLDDKLPJ_02640 [Phycisphaerae bacterium]|nr:hypothetical protein [Phycisphaerae bacterium]